MTEKTEHAVAVYENEKIARAGLSKSNPRVFVFKSRHRGVKQGAASYIYSNNLIKYFFFQDLVPLCASRQEGNTLLDFLGRGVTVG